jgi:photosystem II stability/assembly factor-like uncharacterized protein
LKRALVFTLGSVVLLVLLTASDTPFISGSAPDHEGWSVFQTSGRTILVTSSADRGSGTFRQALLNARNGDTISFDPDVFPLDNPTTITLFSLLPALEQGEVTISGSDAGVILDGSVISEGAGLGIMSNGNVIKGLQILNFPHDAIHISEAGNNLIGGINATPGKSCTGDCNLISGNGFGIGVYGEGSVDNVISGNYIGTNLSGTAAMGNIYNGIGINGGAQNNLIGGDTPGKRNLISGNGEDGVQINDSNTMSNIVSGNYIGTNASGTALIPNSHIGVNLGNGAQNNLIGGDTASERNLISGNLEVGVLLGGNGVMNNIVNANYIGTDATGKVGLGIQTYGIVIQEGALDNLIGDDTEGEGNLISGNLNAGISIRDSGTMNNTVRGNWIGLYLDEARQAFPSDMAISPAYLNDCTLYVTTFSTGVHKSTDCGEAWFEVNSGLTKSSLEQVEIPPDATDGNTLYALSFDGHLFISTDGAANWSLVSTTMQGFDFRNLVLSASFSTDRIMYASAEGWSTEEYGGEPGVFMSNDGGVTWRQMSDGMTDTNVRKVVVSPDPAAKEILFALTYSGVEMSANGGANWATIAFPDGDLSDLALSPTFASDQTIFVTTISGRIYSSTDGGANWDRISELDGDPRSLALSPNFSSDRKICLFSDEGGPHIYCSTDGGNTFEKHDPLLVGNLEISGTRIAFSPNYPSDATIFMISNAGLSRSTDGGTTWGMARGLRDLGNVNGVSIENGANRNIIGPGNVISNNNGGVVIIGNDTAHNIVIGNIVGADPTGTFAQANSGGGAEIRGGHDNLIGGITDADRNILSGNLHAGMWLGFTDTTSNTVIGNFIGTDITGTAALGNGGEGGVIIIYGAQQNTIGGEANDERNVISGNEHDGVYIGDSGTKNNIISGNYIGTDTSGKEPMGNSGHGVSVNSGAELNVIGPGNTIAFNVSGVAIIGRSTTGNRITQNNISYNNEVGIETRDGGNTEISTPAITFIGTRIINGTTLPEATVEVFSDEEDEGQVYEGNTIADAEGNFTFRLPAGRFTGPHITSTATDLEGNTSHFSPPESPPVPTVTRELPRIVAPSQVSVELRVVGTNLGLALFCVIFFGFTSTVLNSILEDYRDELAGAVNIFIPQWLVNNLNRASLSLRGMTTMGRSRLLLMWLVVLLITSIIESFLDPNVGVLSLERLGLLLTLFISALVVSALEIGSDMYAHRRWAPKMRVESKLQWIGLVFAIASVVLSRALDFKPGYLYGIVGALYLTPKLTETTNSGKRAIFVLVSVFAGGFILWLASALLPTTLVELEPLLLTIFLISLQEVFFQLFPLAITEGGDIWSWRRGIWFVFFAVVFFCFYHFLLNPNASDVQALQQNGVQTLLILIMIFGLITSALWLLFPYRLGRKKAIT